MRYPESKVRNGTGIHSRKEFWWLPSLCLLALVVIGTGYVQAQGETKTAKAESEKQHPLDPALKIARQGLEHIQKNVRDYTCTIIKRERVNGELTDHQYMSAKVRHEKEVDGKIEAPFSVYLKFLKPKSVEGREVIWVKERNENKLVVHEGGLLNLKRLWLPPDGFLAMNGQRYPIWEIGIENLIKQLLVKGERDRQYGEVEVKFFEGAMVNGRKCRMIQVIHPIKRPHFEFYKAQIFFDEQLRVPLRYASYSWPEKEGAEPPLEEEYTYTDLKLNVGLTDKDFDPDNEEYNYPSL